MKKIIKFADLCSGMGGFRFASENINLKKFKLKHIIASDIDDKCEAVYKSIFGSKDIFEKDLKNLSVKSNQFFKIFSKVDLVFAGFPCQPFSNIGNKKGLDDERGYLFFYLTEILKLYKPKFFIFENVQKIRNLKKGSTLSKIINILENCGYHVNTHDLNLKDYGLPQNRRRVFFCGYLKKKFNKKNILEPKKIELSKCKYPTTWHLLEKKMDLKHIVPKKTRNTVFKKNDKWQGKLGIDNLIARPLTASMGKWHRSYQDNYFSKKFVTSNLNNFDKKKEVNLFKEEVRRVSTLECLRLQGFPDNTEKYFIENKISQTSSYKIIGNSVPVPLASAVISNFLKYFI
ncbi:DNA (cytosine-5-)-methyltransferase [Candidatus Pelagibacter sp.]|nr:DNA (cytosine-5-)-methyltransferase [Candidatus Pelagibacter sp.]|tara:strand:+ start:1346 stop:2380 length:1035 start_codon:yes stop_codon:yes gene_type:complete